jgi:elongation factor P--(R)-beta-lysine ligase
VISKRAIQPTAPGGISLSKLELLKMRAKFYERLRDFFGTRDYLEVQTPIYVPVPGTEVYLDYFESDWRNHAGQPTKGFLRSSPEIHLKKLLCQGATRIFEVAPCFRNHGEVSGWHRPEFHMLEWYRIGATYESFMEETEELICEMARGLSQNGYKVIDLSKPFQRISVYEAFHSFAGIELLDQDIELSAKGRAAGVVSCRQGDDFETSFFKILLDRVEPALAQLEQVILYDYPPSQAALAKIDSGRAKRFEVYLKGVEISNAFIELQSRDENLARITEANKKRQQNGAVAIGADSEFIDLLEKGLPACAGNALGVDRLMAVLTGCEALNDVMNFDFWAQPATEDEK